jgi:hypothetical protein
MGMQTRSSFQCLRKALEASLIYPPTRDAIEQVAKLVPSGTGPRADLLDCVLLVDNTVWRFRTSADARRFGEIMETYFRNFDPDYRITALEQPALAPAAMSVA